MTNEELRGNLLGLGVYLRAQSNRLDKLGHDAEADASRRHAKYIVRLVNKWTPDAPATPGMLCPRCGGCTWEAEQHPWESQPRQEMCRRCAGTGTVPAPAAPAVAEVGSQWKRPGGGWLPVTVEAVTKPQVRFGWGASGGSLDLDEFVKRYEPVPAPPAPEPRGWLLWGMDSRGGRFCYSGLPDSKPQALAFMESTKRNIEIGCMKDTYADLWIEPAERVTA